MLTGKDKVIDFLKFNEMKFWRLRRTDAGPFLFAQLDESFTMDDSMRRLTDALNYLDPGNYFIECGEGPSDKRGWHKTPFRIEGGVLGMAGIGAMTMQTGITPEEVSMKIAEALEKERAARKIEELEKQLKEAQQKARELEQESNNFSNRLMTRIEPYVGSILQGLGINPQQPAGRIAGIEDTHFEHMEEKAEDQQKRLEAAFERWSKYESDPALVIEKIVDLAESNPAVYAKAKNLLFNPSLLNLLG